MNIVNKIEDALGKIVMCDDDNPRRLIKIEDRHLTYEVPLNHGYWMKLSPTRRWEIEPRFLGQPILDELPPLTEPITRG